MTDITEADHDAVDWLYEMGVIAPHHLRLANEAFARHREQTERQSADLIETQAREIERLRRTLNQIAWLAQRPYDPDEQLTGGEGYASEGQAGSEA